MDEIRIPIPNINLKAVVKRKAATAINEYLAYADLQSIAYQLPDYRDQLTDKIDEDLERIKGKGDKLLFISELLYYLSGIYNDTVSRQVTDAEGLPYFTSVDEIILSNLEDVQYHLHSTITDLGFSIDPNSMTLNEVKTMESTVEEIIERLDELKAGDAILYERIEELKDDFKDVLTTLPLGKKNTKQRLLGILAGYLGEKGADKIYNAITPLLTEILNDPSKLLG